MRALAPWRWLLLGLPLVAGAVWLGYAMGMDLRRERLSERIADYAALHARLIPSELGGYDMLSYASQAPVLEAALLAPRNERKVERANRFLHKLAEDSDSASALLAGPKGKIIAANDMEFVGTDVSFRPYFQNAIAGKHDTFLALAVFSKELGYFVSQPLTNESGKVSGVLIIKRDLVREDYLAQEDGDDFLSFLTDRNGVIILSDVPEWNFSSLKPLSDVQRREIDQHRQYENQSLSPLDWQEVETVGSRQAVARFPYPPDAGGLREFLLHSEPVPELDWELHVLAGMSGIGREASVYALGAGGLATIAVLLAFGIIQRERYRRSLLHQALRDPLTGLYTRLFMEEYIEHVFGAQDRNEIQALSLILLDLDEFKHLNDTLGHNAGDAILRQIADILISNKRRSDIVVRYGGEEFAIFCTETDVTGARALAERIRKQVEATRFQVDDHSLSMALSAGVAARSPGQSLESLVEAADKRLYEAKHAGRNRVH